MATNNLISNTLGQILMQSGNGTPDHIAPASSMYYNNDNNLLWINQNGGADGWMLMTPAIYGELDLDTNTTLSTPSGINVFFSLSGLSWTNYNNNLKGFTVNNNKLVLNNGLSGTYRIIGSLGVLYNAKVNNYLVGVSINGVTPGIDRQAGTNTLTTKTAGHGTVIFDTFLNGGDTIEMTVAPTISGIGTFRVRNGNLVVYRIFN